MLSRKKKQLKQKSRKNTPGSLVRKANDGIVIRPEWRNLGGQSQRRGILDTIISPKLLHILQMREKQTRQMVRDHHSRLTQMMAIRGCLGLACNQRSVTACVLNNGASHARKQATRAVIAQTAARQKLLPYRLDPLTLLLWKLEGKRLAKSTSQLVWPILDQRMKWRVRGADLV